MGGVVLCLKFRNLLKVLSVDTKFDNPPLGGLKRENVKMIWSHHAFLVQFITILKCHVLTNS